VQLQAQIGRQDEPGRNLLLFAGCGHQSRQPFEELLFEAQLKKVPLIGFADDFNLIEFTRAERFQDPLRVMFNDVEVNQFDSPFGVSAAR
jgi:hypothetical protein